MIWLVNNGFRFLMLLILLRVAASWLDPGRRMDHLRLLYAVTDPLLVPFRRLFYLRGMRFDFSPLIALLCLEIARGLSVTILTRMLS